MNSQDQQQTKMEDDSAAEFQALLNKNPLVVKDESEFASLLDTARFSQIQRIAKMFASSDLVPEVFQGKVANCAVALQMAFRLQVDPMMLMQNMYILKGKPGIEAKLAIALINSRGPFTGPVQWRFEGEGKQRKCTAYAKHKGTGEICEADVTWSMVESEGWSSKGGSKWLTIPEMMFRYRSAMFLGRLYCPEVLLGLNSNDELRDIDNIDDVVMPKSRPEIRMPTEKIQAAAEFAAAVVGVVDNETGEVFIGKPEHQFPNGTVVQASNVPYQNEATYQPEEKKPDETKDASSPVATPGMLKRIRAVMEKNNLTDSDLESFVGKKIHELRMSEVNGVLQWAESCARN